MTDSYSSEKPAFDPSQPFEAASSKPPFDPSKPFEPAKPFGIGDIWPVRLAKAIGHSIESAVTLPGDVYAGRARLPSSGAVPGSVEFGSPESSGERVADLATLASPVSPATRVGVGFAGVPKSRPAPAPPVAEALGDEFAARFPPGAVKPGSAAAEFGIPLSTGEADKDFGKIAFEQSAARGGYGDKAQKAAQEFYDMRGGEAKRAIGDVGTGMDRFGQNVAENPIAAAETVAEGLNKTAEMRKGLYKQDYETFGSLPGEMHAGAFEGIGQKIKGSLSLKDNPVIIDDVTTPIASKAIQDIENNIARLKVQNRADPFGAPNPENIVGINLKGIEQTRKRLSSFAQDARANPTDRRATDAVVRAFDEHVQNALDDGLFSGDPRAFEVWKDAREGFKRYQKDFTPQRNDAGVGAIIDKIVNRDDGAGATAGEVANLLFGANGTGASGQSLRLAYRVRQLLGEDSPEWSGVRQGMWKKLTESTEGRTDWGPQKISERILEFTNGSGKSLAQLMYAPTELGQMRRLAMALKETVAPVGSVNYSNTATTLASMIGNATDGVTAMLGLHSFGLPGAVAGWLLRVGRKSVAETAQARKLAKSLYGSQPSKLGQAAESIPSVPLRITVRPGLVGAGAEGQPNQNR